MKIENQSSFRVQTMSQAVAYPPIETFDAVQAQLRRPEDVAFSPEGDVMVVANADGDSITIYRQSVTSETSFEREPVQILQDHRTFRVRNRGNVPGA